MSGRSRAAAGTRQGRSASGKSRYAAGARRKRADDERRDQINTVGDARRGDVYRADVEFAPEDAGRRLPKRGPERDGLAAEVAAAKASGATHLEVAIQFGYQVSQIGAICKEYGISSVSATGRPAGTRPRKGWS